MADNEFKEVIRFIEHTGKEVSSMQPHAMP